MPLFTVTTARGLEAVLKEELIRLGIKDPTIKAGALQFEGDYRAAYRVLYQSRIASRLLMKLREFECPSPEALYAGVRAQHWTEQLTLDQTFAIDVTTTRSQITHTHFAALKAKDAIVDQFRTLKGGRPSIDPKSPDLRIQIHIEDDFATLNLDLSGERMHRRGYREEQGAAPLKETLAAGLLHLLGFQKAVDDATASNAPLSLWDLTCGSGTLLIEGAMMALDIPPRILRHEWGVQRWLHFDPKIWREVKEDGLDRMNRAKLRSFRAHGFDQNERVLEVAKANAARAGVSGAIRFERRTLGTWMTGLSGVSAGGLPKESVKMEGKTNNFLIMNPPYGERLGEVQELIPFYRTIGDVMKKQFTGFSAGILVGDADLSKEVGLRAKNRHPVFNGPIECRFLTFDLYQ